MTQEDKKINLKADLYHIEFLLEENDIDAALFWLEKFRQDVANSEVVA